MDPTAAEETPVRLTSGEHAHQMTGATIRRANVPCNLCKVFRHIGEKADLALWTEDTLLVRQSSNQPDYSLLWRAVQGRQGCEVQSQRYQTSPTVAAQGLETMKAHKVRIGALWGLLFALTASFIQAR